MITVCFDCDGTLIKENGEPNKTLVHYAAWLSLNSHINVIVWSGGGQQYAKDIAKKYGLYNISAHSKNDTFLKAPDIAIDDMMDCGLGEHNFLISSDEIFCMEVIKKIDKLINRMIELEYESVWGEL